MIIDKTLRIIDANFNRLIEAIRVLEEISRFILNDKLLSAKLKNIRSSIKDEILKIYKGDDLVSSRDSKNDVGRTFYTKSESNRESIYSIITSNLKRGQEASRVLEEFTKLTSKSTGKFFKNIRFKLYELEKTFAKTELISNKKEKLDFDLYVVTDPDVLSKKPIIKAVQDAIEGGAKIVQFRDKKCSMKEYYQTAKKLSILCKKLGAVFIVNDHIDICLAVDADGIHLGQDDIPIKVARKILGDDKIIGLSTHSFEQAMNGLKSGADYISIGPIFQTPSKPNSKNLGIPLLKKIANNIKKSNKPLPFAAIGGINETNINSVAKITKKIAVIRAVFGKNNIKKAVKTLRRSIFKR